MKLLKILTSSLLLFCVLLGSGCCLSKAGNYVADKSKSAYGATKSALGFEQDSE